MPQCETLAQEFKPEYRMTGDFLMHFAVGTTVFVQPK